MRGAVTGSQPVISATPAPCYRSEGGCLDSYFADPIQFPDDGETGVKSPPSLREWI